MERSVLIVDDSKVMRMFVANHLPPALAPGLPEEDTWDIREAGDGQAAVDAYRERRPDVVILDLTMPIKDGPTALAEIMAMDPTARVVVMTADIQTRSVLRVLELGALTVLRKPPVRETVQEALALALLPAGGAP